MSIDEAIRHCEEVADGQTEQGKCPECAMEHRQLAEWLTDYKRLKERESYKDEYIKYIKVPKEALKYRTAGMVAYNAEWLKNHFDIERVVICGAQEPCDDAISRQAAIDRVRSMEEWHTGDAFNSDRVIKHIKDLPSVNPQRTGHWISSPNGCFVQCSECGLHGDKGIYKHYKYCPYCGAKMVEPQVEREDATSRQAVKEYKYIKSYRALDNYISESEG